MARGSTELLIPQNLTITGPIWVGNGSAAAPSIAFAGDPTTGVYTNGSSDIRFAVAGSQKFFINNSGGGTVGLTTGTVLTFGNGSDLVLTRIAANTLGLQNSTAPNQINIYSSANYIGITGSTNTTTTNVYTVTGGQGATTPNTGWAQISVSGTTAWVPYWSNVTP